MNRAYLISTALLTTVGLAATATAEPITYTVDCTGGQTISAALARGDARKPLVVNILGTCNEYVTIARDDVTLRGEPGAASGVNGPGSAAPAILIQADRARLENLTVTGGANGVELGGPFIGYMTNVVVQEPASGHAVVSRAGELQVSGCTLTQANIGLNLLRGGSARVFGGTEIRGNSGSGIFAGSNSTVAVGGGSKIRDNGLHGVELSNGSVGNINNAEISGNLSGIVVSASSATIGANTVSNNREHGILAQAGAVVSVDNNTVTGNQQHGVFGYLGSTVVLHGNSIADNAAIGVYCRADCTLQIGGARITGNGDSGIGVMLGSRLILEAPVTDATGNLGGVDLWCGDTESSTDGLAEFFLGSTAGCTGFND